jgi:predicted secreted protein
MATTRLTLQDSGRHVTLAVGDRLVVQLDESPTSGYTWRQLATADVLRLDTSELATVAPGAPGVVGGGSQRHWVFSARQPGTTLLQLKLMQAWADEDSAVNTFSLTVDTLPG